MRLIVGKDYYDSGLRYGIDQDLVFVRDGSYEQKGWFDPWPHIVEWKPHQRHYNGKGIPHLLQTAVIFAGVLYRGFVENYTTHGFDKATRGQIRYFWTASSLPEEYKDVYFRDYFKNDVWRPQMATRTEEYFIPKPIPETVAARIVVGIGRPVLNERVVDRTFDWSYNCTGLNQVGFQKVLDPFTAFQRLEAFVSNLPRNPNPMVEITDDKVKIAKHGFDKWSFRKQSGQKS